MPFPLLGMPPLPSSTVVSSFLFYILGTESYSFFIPVLFLLLYLFFYTLYTALLLSLLFLFLPLSSFMLSGKDCTIYFLLVLQGEILALNFYRFKLSCLYILYTLHRLLLSPPWSISSQVETPLLGACSSHHSIPVSFPIWDMLAFSLSIPFMDQPHVLLAHFFPSVFLLLYLGIPICSAQSPNI